MKSRSIRIRMQLSELRNLSLWATYGVRKARGGTGQRTILRILRDLDKRFKLQIGKIEFGQCLH